MPRNYGRILVAIIVLLIAVVVFFVLYLRQFRNINQGEESGQQETSEEKKTEVVQAGLDTPWEIEFGPEGKIYVTERPGRLKVVDGDRVETIQVPEVEENAEGGLLGLALHPNFSENQQIYLYKTTTAGGNLKNVVEEYKLDGNRLTERRMIVDNIPAAGNHNGGRIAFGPDGLLYIATGDASQPSLAQDRNSLAGKILRVNENGRAANGNPFNNLVYSYGHRNPEGLAWDDRGRLWATEHGSSANDEINRIQAGRNYGWPEIQGSQTRSGMESPVITSGNETWAPAGIAFKDGRLFFGGLRGQALISVRITDSGVDDLRRYFSGKYGRIRAVIAKDGFLYFSTSNRDGRGIPSGGDDRIIKSNEI